MFDIFSLTKREKSDLDYKRKILTLAKEHEKAGELEKVDRYYMPKDDVVSTCDGTMEAGEKVDRYYMSDDDVVCTCDGTMEGSVGGGGGKWICTTCLKMML